MPALISKIQELLSSPAAFPLLQEVLSDPERWARYKDLTYEPLGTGNEAGYEIMTLACESMKYIAGLSREDVQELISGLEEVKENG